MATLTITIPDAVATDIYTALCARAGTPVSGANAKAAVIAILKTIYAAHKADVAGTAASASAATQANIDAALT